MLDVGFIKHNKIFVEENLKKRGFFISLKKILLLEKERKKKIFIIEKAKKNKNDYTRNFIINFKKNNLILLKKEKKKVKQIEQNIIKWKKQKEKIIYHLNKILLEIPNILEEEVVYGFSRKKNIEIYRKSFKKTYPVNLKNHFEIGKILNILDFSSGVKTSGTNFVFLKNIGAKLERALINFMLDIHSGRGYSEVNSPFLVKENSLINTGQFPKFSNEIFKIKDKDLFLIPTGEVPFINLFSNKILNENILPIKLCGCTPCFRKEAGAAGKKDKGLIRLHQFNKVELIQLTSPKKAEEAFQEMLLDVEYILKKLELPYRIVRLCSGEVTFSAVKTYDFEVFFPATNEFKEVSSCSLCNDFQSIRSRIKIKTKNNKTFFPYTLNASGLAIGRIMASILENYQEQDNVINIPEVLIPYLGIRKIKK